MASAKFKFYVNAILRELTMANIISRDDTFDLVDIDGNTYVPRTPSSALDLDLPGALWFKEVDSAGPGLPNTLELYYYQLLVLVVDRDTGNLIYGIGNESIVPLSKGGTGADNANDARIALGLGTAAQRNVGTAVGNLIEVLTGGKLPVLDGSNLTNVPSFPVGIPFPWASNVNDPPNSIECDGSLLLRASYPALFNVIGEEWGAGDGTTTFRAPDLRGVFIRGLDNGRGLDTGRVFGSFQDHAFKNHGHRNKYYNGYGLNGVGTGGSGWQSNWATSYSNATSSENFVVNSDDTNAGTETRPVNVAMPWFIRYQ